MLVVYIYIYIYMRYIVWILLMIDFIINVAKAFHIDSMYIRKFIFEVYRYIMLYLKLIVNEWGYRLVILMAYKYIYIYIYWERLIYICISTFILYSYGKLEGESLYKYIHIHMLCLRNWRPIMRLLYLPQAVYIVIDHKSNWVDFVLVVA